jgi:hypothetical protein
MRAVLGIYTVKKPKRSQVSFTPWWKPEIGTEESFIVLVSRFIWPKQLNVFWEACANFYFPFFQLCGDSHIYPIHLIYFVFNTFGQFKEDHKRRLCNVHMYIHTQNHCAEMEG